MSKLFFLKDIDSHYIIKFLSLIIKIKHKAKFEYTKAKEFGLNTTEDRTPKIIVSMTSYPQRIETTHLAIHSLLRQSLKPDKVILWLTEEEFPNKEDDLPESILSLKDLGLTIEWCEAIKNYKKNIPAFRKYPNDIVITVDDDVYYKQDFVESLYSAYLKNPNQIYAKRISPRKLTKNKIKRLSIKEHCFEKNTEASYLNFLNGAGGILYPPNSLHKNALSGSTKILNDDYFMWAMAVLNHTKICEVTGFEENLNFIENTQDSSFSKNKANDLDWANITLAEYPELIKIIGGNK